MASISDEETVNFGLTKIGRREGWANAMNENLERLGALFYQASDGSFYLCKNAIAFGDSESEPEFDPLTWLQADTSKRSSAIRLNEDGSFAIMTCAAGNYVITWTTVMVVGSDGSVTIPGNLTSSGIISGDITALLLLSDMTINSNKDWGGYSLTNLGTLTSASGNQFLNSDGKLVAKHSENLLLYTPESANTDVLVSENTASAMLPLASDYAELLELPDDIPGNVIAEFGSNHSQVLVEVDYSYNTLGSVYLKFAVNGTVVGSGYSGTGVNSGTYSLVIDIEPGDTIQIYGYDTVSPNSSVSNLKMYALSAPVSKQW